MPTSLHAGDRFVKHFIRMIPRDKASGQLGDQHHQSRTAGDVGRNLPKGQLCRAVSASRERVPREGCSPVRVRWGQL
jgi:hypothetical protein